MIDLSNNFKIILDSKASKNYIVTIAIGEQYFKDWENYVLPSWKAYCKKFDIGLIVFINDLVLIKVTQMSSYKKQSRISSLPFIVPLSLLLLRLATSLFLFDKYYLLAFSLT